jgi:potassium-transporting ATPase KdpC subunit
MSSHLRANLWLLLFTVALCSVLYPLILLGVGQTAFPHQSAGSLVDAEGKPVTEPDKARGSLLIAQEFKGAEYFQPRPSHAGAGYDASASGASNWGASNYLLRDRVARQLGTLARYRDGRPVARAVEAWFRKKDAELAREKKPGLVAQWAQAHPSVVLAWVKADKAHEKLVQAWLDTPPPPQAVARWRQENPGKEGPGPADVAVAFFTSFSLTHPAEWPAPGGDPLWGLTAVFFDAWRQDNPKEDLLEVPADMVTASGSGLDPHITLKNALYQARWRMAEAWAKKFGKEKNLPPKSARLKAIEDKAQQEIARLAEDLATAPLGGLVGVRLVNVLEANQELGRRMRKLAAGIQ